MKRGTWTAAEDARLVALFQEGLTGPAMAKALGRALAAIQARISELRRRGHHGLPQRHRQPRADLPQLPAAKRCGVGSIWTVSEMERLRDLHQQGYGPTAMAKALGRTTGAVAAMRTRLQRLDWVITPTKGVRINWTDDDDRQLVALWQEGLRATQIGRRLGRSTASVNGRADVLRKAGHDLPVQGPGGRPVEMVPAPAAPARRRCPGCKQRRPMAEFRHEGDTCRMCRTKPFAGHVITPARNTGHPAPARPVPSGRPGPLSGRGQ